MVNRLKQIISETVKRVIKESFAEQWEDEIKIFMKGLKNGQALVDNGYVAVEWGHDETDPRYIYYKEGDDRLTDDHFSQQHSRRLYWNEIADIRDCAKHMYGVDIYVPEDEYYDEIYGEYEIPYVDKELCENVVRNVVRKSLYEQDDYSVDDYNGEYDDEYEDEFEDPFDEYEDAFEEYEKGYPNVNFDVSNVSAIDLADWCENCGDFYYVYQGLRGWQIMVANTDEIVEDIVNDLYNCYIEPTHEMDYLFFSKENLFEYNYVCIFKVVDSKDGDYYIVYQQEKNNRSNYDLC